MSQAVSKNEPCGIFPFQISVGISFLILLEKRRRLYGVVGFFYRARDGAVFMP
jgi:hypothetical protein